jgi:hypothetical protein
MARNAPKCSSVGCFRDAVARSPHNGVPLCEVCLRRYIGGNLRDYSSQPARKIPNKALSVEIECFAPNQDSFVAATHVGFACSDGSLPNFGCEFKLVGHRDKMPQVAARFLNRLSSIRMQVNNKCGLHVGVDLRHLPPMRRFMVTQWLRKYQAEFYKLVPRSRRVNRYCFPLRYGFDWEKEAMRTVFGDRFMDVVGPMYRDTANSTCYSNIISRNSYSGWAEHACVFNEAKPGRLEVRLHPGSVNPHKVRAWLDIWRQFQTHWESTPEFEGSESAILWSNSLQPCNIAHDAMPDWFKNLPHPVDMLTGIGREYWNARISNGGILPVKVTTANALANGDDSYGDD